MTRNISNLIYSSLALCSLTFSSCSKSSDSASSEAFPDVEKDVINNFVNNTAVPQYDNLVITGTGLNNNITALNNTLTDDNLALAQTSWKQMRQVWERQEGFLVGPVED